MLTLSLLETPFLDIDHDGDTAVVYSDRIGATSGICWLEHTGGDASGNWQEASRVEYPLTRFEGADAASAPRVTCSSNDWPSYNVARHEIQSLEYSRRNQRCRHTPRGARSNHTAPTIT